MAHFTKVVDPRATMQGGRTDYREKQYTLICAFLPANPRARLKPGSLEYDSGVGMSIKLGKGLEKSSTKSRGTGISPKEFRIILSEHLQESHLPLTTRKLRDP